ncbi:MAG: tryptophan synthase subunit alpha [Desulfobacteraceae bacterium]|jgi:tryptophan synthase alpha chain|nr:MAG: tryptophan synthase subunit alpha [Desulfobacteraceae bacterium]
MNRIESTFRRLRANNEKALVGFVTAGDPDMEKSLSLVSSMCAAGLDMLELGVPFSDPTADGPIIQRSSLRALAAGINVGSVLEMIAALRPQSQVPIIVFSYYNPLLAYGAAVFHRDALDAGADGVLVVDLPPEESDEFTREWPDERLCLIRLTTPATSLERMEQITSSASGFIYHVSKLGVTGSAGLQFDEINLKVKALRSLTRLPVCVGFGISTPQHIASVAEMADGVVVGSAFESLIEQNVGREGLSDLLSARVAAFKRATLALS